MKRSAIVAGAVMSIGLISGAQPEAFAQPSLNEAWMGAGEAPVSPDGALSFSTEETHPEIKQFAAAVALALTTYEADEEVADIAARLPVSSDRQAAMAAAAALHHEGTRSRGRIVYPQLGGIQPDSASVMVVTEQSVGPPHAPRVETRTLDVRVRRAADGWRFERLASAGGAPVPVPAFLPPEAEAVLNDARIELPDTVRWDIHAGEISIDLLRLMARLAEETPYGVVALSSGHPWEIFGTPRQSDHSRGLAVDIYRTGDALVIDDRAEGSTTYDVVSWLYFQPEVARLGSPWKLEGLDKVSFTDGLHQDHVHVAIRREAP